MKVFGVELKNIQITSGMEDVHICCDIYLNSKLIGIYIDEGSGGNGFLKFCCESSEQKDFYYIAWRYFASYPEIDSIAIYEFPLKDFLEYRGNLPKVSYKGWPDHKVALFFINKLVYYYQIEQQYYQALKEGYRTILVIHYIELKDTKSRPDQIFYTDGSESQFNQVIDVINESSKNYIISQFSSEKDFMIE